NGGNDSGGSSDNNGGNNSDGSSVYDKETGRNSNLTGKVSSLIGSSAIIKTGDTANSFYWIVLFLISVVILGIEFKYLLSERDRNV
ncbi:MAG: hypothetical protein LBM02_03205, partial [Lachnospiraceae bacterium]|nr:hypothetical protein [Lachnospiraceae bacterium]